MPVFNNILAGSSGQATGYDIDQSLRFNDDDGTYLSKAAPGAAGNLNNWTISVWLKRGQTTGLLAGSWEYQFFSQGDVSSNPVSTMSFYSSGANTDKIAIGMYGTSDSNLVCNWTSDSVYRDYSAWYHVVVKWDNTQSAAADILKVYVNGEVVSGTFTTSPSNGTTTVVNKDFKQFLGKYVYGTQPNWWDGYMAEYHFIDGQSLTSASFGETNSDTNQWVPIEYAGSYGTQGWYLNFSNSSSLGADSSGNGNNFTANVLAATDQVLDSPTNNFATLNSVDAGSGTLSEGNLVSTGTTDRSGTFLLGSGKWAWKVTANATGSFGIALDGLTGTEYTYSASSSDVLEFELDLTANTLDVRVNSGSPSSVATGLTGSGYVPLMKAACTCDFGQDTFTPTDSAFTTVCTDNLASASASTFSYVGNGNADGPFVYMGYLPSSITISGTTYSLGSYNPSDSVDWVSNGIKVRSSSTRNSNGTTYSITSAPVEQDFKYSNAR